MTPYERIIMNDKTKLGISLAVAVGTTVPTILHYFHVHRTEQAKRDQIQLNLDLDLSAIRRAKQQVMEEVKNGMYDHLNVDEMLKMLNNRIEFERITIR